MGYVDHNKLADYIVAYCNLNKLGISNKKLQKLVYYCQAWTLALKRERLIEHEFEAWLHGAVLRPLYFRYWAYGYNNISMKNDEAELIVSMFSKATPNDFLEIVNKVLHRYASYNADELEAMNHSEYPW